MEIINEVAEEPVICIDSICVGDTFLTNDKRVCMKVTSRITDGYNHFVDIQTGKTYTVDNKFAVTKVNCICTVTH